MWSVDKYVPQTRQEPKDSVGSWVEGEKGVEDEDILVYSAQLKSRVDIVRHWYH